MLWLDRSPSGTTIFWGKVSVACTCCFVSLAERDLLYGVCCCCGQVACVLNNVTWQPLLECHHGTPVDEPPGVAVYQEVEEMRAVLAPVQVGGGWASLVSRIWQLHTKSGAERGSFGISGKHNSRPNSRPLYVLPPCRCNCVHSLFFKALFDINSPWFACLCVLVQRQQQPLMQREARARYLVSPLPVDVTSIAPPTNKPNPKLGISSMSWSPDSMLLATVNENMPHAVWVWDVEAATLAAVLLHLSSVRSIAWSPSGPTLTVTTGGGRVYMWTATGSSIVHIPLPGFNAGCVAWGPDGSSMVLMDKDGFCCAYLAAEGS